MEWLIWNVVRKTFLLTDTPSILCNIDQLNDWIDSLLRAVHLFLTTLALSFFFGNLRAYTELGNEKIPLKYTEIIQTLSYELHSAEIFKIPNTIPHLELMPAQMTATYIRVHEHL